MIADAAGSTAAAGRRTLGFLFADLRGYTSFVERHGDDNAALLLRDYRRLVREVVGRFGGAEIKTEGDSFYVVFTSASAAVECGLTLIDEAQTASAGVPERPIQVGVGIHAGETVESEGGFVGSAVNIAARVCSVARAGEVAVTETVRGLVRTSLPVHFVPRGTPHLKGIDQPIPVFAVLRGVESHRTHESRWRQLAGRRGWVAALAITLVIASLAGVGALAAGVRLPWAGPGVSASPSPAGHVASSSSAPIRITSRDVSGLFRPKALAPGRYELPDVQPAVSFAIGGRDWVLRSEFADSFSLDRHLGGSTDADASIVGFRARVTLNGPCRDSTTKLIGLGPGSLIAALQANHWISVTDPVPVNIGGRSGLRVDVKQARSSRGACVIPPGAREPAGATFLFLFGNDDGYWIAPDERVRVVALEVEGATFVLLEGAARGSDFDLFMQSAQPIINSLSFGSS